jgi:hypothetical protein
MDGRAISDAHVDKDLAAGLIKIMKPAKRILIFWLRAGRPFHCLGSGARFKVQKNWSQDECHLLTSTSRHLARQISRIELVNSHFTCLLS